MALSVAEYAAPAVPVGSEEVLTLTGALTVTVAVAFGKNVGAEELAVMIEVPLLTPVTGTVVVVALAAKDTVAGTVAEPVLLELRLMVKPAAGAGDESVSVRFCGDAAVIVAVFGVKAIVPTTFTVCVPEAYPVADPVMVADP